MAEEVYEVAMKDNERDIFFVALLTILGMAVRLSATLSASFPLNDGGLFYQMIVDLQNNNFILPVTTTYNFAEIPFAYPPFAFYVYGLLSASGIPLLKLMQFLPAIVTTLTIPAFYFFAKDILANKQQALFSTMAFDWLIMGGGVRSLVDRVTHCILSWDAVSERSTVNLQACLERAPQARQYYSDAFPGYNNLYYGAPYEMRSDKKETYSVEAVNADLRHYLKRLACKSRCFSRRLDAAAH